MTLFAETFIRSLNKQGEELCGDSVEVVRTEDSVIVVLADGLGSGVKASILSTLTSKIAASMLRQGATLEEVVDTLAGTLPVCQVRQLAYSTFLILQVHLRDRSAYLVEYDCPATYLWRRGRMVTLEKNQRTVSGRRIAEAHFDIEEGDVFVLVSDGVIHAGVGAVLNLGWQWDHVSAYLQKLLSSPVQLSELVQTLAAVCDNLYLGKPGDDVTVAGLKVRINEQVTILAGPPEDPAADADVVQQLLAQPGNKVVCGGTTAQLVSRCSGRPLLTSLEQPTQGVPPTAAIPGLDLVTEGVLTLGRTLELIRKAKAVQRPGRNPELDGADGAARLARLLLYHCTQLRVFLGRAENPAHRELADQLLPRRQVVEAICQELRELGTEVQVAYC